MSPRRIMTLIVAGCLLAGCSSAGSVGAATSSPASTATTSPCGVVHATTYSHVIWIFMENRSYSSVLGSAGDAPRLAAYGRACGVATNYHGITHPSLPNYIAATSGGTHGISTDCTPDTCSKSVPSLFGQVSHAGKQWAGYAEGMNGTCDRTSHGRYAARHNPAVYYRPIHQQCLQHDVVMGASSGALAHALQQRRLPAFAFMTPNLCDDGHDCSTATADRWLGDWLDRITSSPSYAAGHTIVFVTWDESERSNASNHIATVVIGPSVPAGRRVGTRFTHYSLLRTTEGLLGLTSLGHAATATSMRAAFGL